MQSGRPSIPRKLAKPSSRTRFIIGCLLDVLGIVAVIMALIFPFHFFLPPWSYTETTVTVEPYKTTQIDYDFFMGGIIRGTIANAVESNNSATLNFYMEDSGGETVLGPKRIPERYTFELHPQQTGLHRLILDNTLDIQCNAHVEIKQYYYNIVFLAFGFAIFITGIALITTAP